MTQNERKGVANTCMEKLERSQAGTCKEKYTSVMASFS